MNRGSAEDERTEPARDGVPVSVESTVMPSSARRRLSLFLFLTALLFCAWFFQVGNVNQIARYDAIFAFFENTGDDAHTFRIDRYLGVIAPSKPQGYYHTVNVKYKQQIICRQKDT